MGTRSLTTINDEQGRPLLTMYRQFDGYMEGHGEELAEFLQGIQLTNGFTMEQSKVGWANGMGCLAAQIVAHFKTGIGNFYIQQPGSTDHGEEYRYTVNLYNGQLHITVLNGWGDEVFQGSPVELLDKVRPA